MAETPEVKAESTEASGVKSEVVATPEVKIDAPEVKVDVPEVKVDAPEVKAKKTEVKVDTPDVKVKAPEAKTEKPEVKADTPEVKADTPEVKVDTTDNSDTNDKVVEISPLEQKIIRQVEYYFGDYNLPKDKFLQEHIKKDDGWVPMETMLNFQRLKCISADTTVICNALLKSTAKLMDVSEDRTKIRRNPEKPLPELSDARRQEIIGRSIYMKGFPTEGTHLDMLLEFLTPFGTTDNIQMRNYHDKVEDKWKFKGSIFVTFPTKKEAEEFLKLDSVKHGDVELIRKWQADYIQEKKIEAKEGKRGKDKRKQNLKDAADGHKPSDEKVEDSNGTSEGATEGGEKEAEHKEEHVMGAVLVLKGLKETTKWMVIKDRLVELGADVVFVDFAQGDAEAFARLKETGSAQKALDKMESGKMEIDGVDVEARVLEGEEEIKYLDDQQEARKTRRIQLKRKGSQRGRGRGRGGKRGRH